MGGLIDSDSRQFLTRYQSPRQYLLYDGCTNRQQQLMRSNSEGTLPGNLIACVGVLREQVRGGDHRGKSMRYPFESASCFFLLLMGLLWRVNILEVIYHVAVMDDWPE